MSYTAVSISKLSYLKKKNKSTQLMKAEHCFEISNALSDVFKVRMAFCCHMMILRNNYIP